KVPMGPYHNIAKYNPVRKTVIFGAGNGSKELHELDARGEITKLPESPVLIRISSTVVSIDPVSGDLLVLNTDAKNKFYALDLTKKEWKSLPDAPITNGVAVPIPAHGVNLYFTSRPEKVFLYKHGSSDK